MIKKEDIEKITNTPSRPAPQPPQKKVAKETPIPIGESVHNDENKKAHASPSVRKFARNLGVNLSFVNGSGNKNRILIEDVERFVKGDLIKPRSENMGASFAPIPMPNIDFSEFGKIETKSLSKIKKLSGANLHRNWVTAPHVTQFDNADITDLEIFRKSMQKEAEKRGAKLTLLAFFNKSECECIKGISNV